MEEVSAAAVQRLASMVQWSSTLPCGRTNQTGCPQMLKGYNKKTYGRNIRVLLQSQRMGICIAHGFTFCGS